MKKRIIAIVLAVLIVCSSVFAFSVSGAESGAKSISDGRDGLIAQFESGKGPKKGGVQIDYVYYSPVGKTPHETVTEPQTGDSAAEVAPEDNLTAQADGKDTTKYPVVFSMFGMGNNKKP